MGNKNKNPAEYDKEPVLTEEQKERQRKAIERIHSRKKYKKIKPLRWLIKFIMG